MTEKALRPSVLVLPAFDVEDVTDDLSHLPTELTHWFDAYDVERERTVPGANGPVYATDGGLALTATGMGKVEAAATVTALLASPAVDLTDASVVTVGVAGTPPTQGTLGDVFVADAVVDWDRKHRWDSADDGRSIDLLRYRPHDYVLELDDSLVDRAVDAASGVELRDDDDAEAVRRAYPQAAARSAPSLSVGTTLCGDEFWHGRVLSDEAQWLTDAYGVGPYCTTEMEDYGTATALDRFDHLDRYLSVRGVVNFDQPSPGQTAAESLDEETGGFALELALENAFRVGRAVVDDLLAAGR